MYVVGKALSGLAIAIGKAGTELPETTTDTATGRAYLKTSTSSAGSKPFFLKIYPPFLIYKKFAEESRT
jgi:hypothetical protein